jgi:hypothetical protein
MSRKHKTLAILGVLALAGFTVLTIGLFHRGPSSQNQKVAAPQPSEAESDSIPPAPPPAPKLKPKPIPKPTALSPTGQSFGPSLLYDEKLSFEANVERLKGSCASHVNDPQLQQLLSQFVKVLFEHAKGQFATVRYALEHIDGPAIYRNIVLDCLVVAEGPISQKADLVWGIATDQDEPIESRRLATRLTSQFVDGKSRSDELVSLLNDPDRGMVVLALKTAPLEMDDRNYKFIKTSLLTSTDVNVRIAAVDAIGSSTMADKQSELLSIILEQHTSQDSIFSDASLLKRRAISHLEINDPQSHDLIKQIVLDAGEDPTVRSKAISRFTPVEFPEAIKTLLDLLQTANSAEGVLLLAIEDNLLTRPSPSILEAIRTKAEGLSDPQRRNFIIKRLENTTKGTNP